MKKIAEINDRFRRDVLTKPLEQGKCVLTQGIATLPPHTQIAIFLKIRAYKTFQSADDPYGEHDFGAVEVNGAPKVFWKIDYYQDAHCNAGTDDTENAYRVLTIMLASEY